MAESQRYWAFLSYSHADAAVAARLHRELESYTLPAHIRKAHGLPRRLVPIFRDVEELEAAAGLTVRLQSALDESRWLVVLCSPASAQSRYVNTEIEYFLRKHGPSRILCVLVAGKTPDCFPPAIRNLSDEPLAADCREGRDFQLAKLRLISAMAVIGFTELRNREAQRKRRRRMSIAAVITAAIWAGGAYWDLFVREQVDYYVSYVRQNGIWQGVDKLRRQTVEHRALSFRFTRHGRLNPPERVDFVGGGGICTVGDLLDHDTGLTNILGDYPYYSDTRPTARYCSATFSYDSKGAIQKESLLNLLGLAKFTLIYTEADLAQISLEGFAAPAAGGGARYVQFTRDAQGHDQRIQFLYSRGIPRANRHYDFGYRFEYDAQGRLISRSGLDADGKDGGESVQLEYSSPGDLIAERNLDAQQRLSLNNEGWATRRYERDAYGNFTRITYLSPDDHPSLSASGYASTRYERDAQGQEIKRCRFDESGHPAMTRDDQVSCEQLRYNDRGEVTRTQLMDVEGHPTEGSQGVAAFEDDYDALGNVIEWRYYDALNRPVDSQWASPLVRIRRDAHGNGVEYQFFDAAGKQAMTPHGTHDLRKFDDRDNLVGMDFLDAQEQPVLNPEMGCARVNILMDERGNEIEENCFGANLKPALGLDGFATAQLRYDDQGNVIETRYLDAARRLIRGKDGFAIEHNRFDRLGQSIEETYFNEHEEPVLIKNGYYGHRDEYDHRGRVAKTLYLDMHGAVARIPQLGYAGVAYSRDALGHVIEEQYLDESTRPVSGVAVSRLLYRLDAFGKELERRYYNGNGVLTPSPLSGCAVLQSEYARNGNLAAERCLDVGEQLSTRKDTGWARHVITREHTRQVKEEFFDAAGRPVKPYQ